MDKKVLESKLHELKGKQANILSQKKADRNLFTSAAVIFIIVFKMQKSIKKLIK